MSTVQDFLKSRPRPDVVCIRHDQTVLEAANRMNEHRIGCVVVVNGERVVGIFTERDVLRRVVGEVRDPRTTKVGEVMTSPCVICHPGDSLMDIQTVMTRQRIRHLPVVEEANRLVGIITSGDILANSSRESQVEIRMLQEYLYGGVCEGVGS